MLSLAVAGEDRRVQVLVQKALFVLKVTSKSLQGSRESLQGTMLPQILHRHCALPVLVIHVLHSHGIYARKRGYKENLIFHFS